MSVGRDIGLLALDKIYSHFSTFWGERMEDEHWRVEKLVMESEYLEGSEFTSNCP